jgi:N6-L-threonylcarbamoyladenine synthase
MREWFQYEVIGETKDDAVGEAFDKVARMLSYPYPGGPEISKAAHTARTNGAASSVTLPRPMLHTNTCDVSFSGLKTAALYALRDSGGIENLSEDERAAFAREFEDAVTDVLIYKTKLALEKTGAKTFVIGGGVAANTHIRDSLTALIQNEFPTVELRLPDVSITGDNAIMIGMAALARSLAKVQIVPNRESIRAEGNLSISTVK